MLSFRERIQEIVESQGSGKRYKEMEELTGVSAKTWMNICNERQKANHEHIEALGKAFPQYAYWLVTGETDERNGHTSPVLERIQNDLRKAGRDAA